MSTIMTLEQVLSQVETFSWTHALYADRSAPLSLGTHCLVHDPDDVETDDDDPPNVVATAGVAYVIGIQDVKDILQNAKHQVPEASAADLFIAFHFYIERDAFIVF